MSHVSRDRAWSVWQDDDARRRRDALMVLILYTCGLRLAELTGLDTDDIINSGSALRVHGKGDKTRIVPLVAHVAREIQIYMEQDSSRKFAKTAKKRYFYRERENVYPAATSSAA